MTPELFEKIKAEADDAKSAEILCGQLHVEFHPLVCEAAADALTGPGNICGHIKRADRERIVAAFAALTAPAPIAEPEPVAPDEPEVATRAPKKEIKKK